MKLEQEKVQSLVSQLRMEESQIRESMLAMRDQIRNDESNIQNYRIEMDEQKSRIEELKAE